MSEAMNGFEIRVTAHFERDLKKLARAHPEAAGAYEVTLNVLSADPHNQSHPEA
jgi:mRNA-degrading endonuclease YafQ of YafQ-DinJ toxin-antitoxin module